MMDFFWPFAFPDGIRCTLGVCPVKMSWKLFTRRKVAQNYRDGNWVQFDFGNGFWTSWEGVNPSTTFEGGGVSLRFLC